MLCRQKAGITVLGGSQGAGILGDLVPDAIAMIETPLGSKMKINQQARPEQIDQLKARYKTLKISASIKPFFNNMPNLLAKVTLSSAGPHHQSQNWQPLERFHLWCHYRVRWTITKRLCQPKWNRWAEAIVLMRLPLVRRF